MLESYLLVSRRPLWDLETRVERSSVSLKDRHGIFAGESTHFARKPMRRSSRDVKPDREAATSCICCMVGAPGTTGVPRAELGPTTVGMPDDGGGCRALWGALGTSLRADWGIEMFSIAISVMIVWLGCKQSVAGFARCLTVLVNGCSSQSCR